MLFLRVSPERSEVSTNESDNDTPLSRSHMDYMERTAGTMVYYAAERTLMSWIRVALGMMALGFVIDRFGLVLAMVPHKNGTISGDYSFWTGAVLVIGGSAVAIVAAIRYIGIELRYRRVGYRAPGNGLPLGIFFTVVVALIGIAIGVYLAMVRY